MSADREMIADLLSALEYHQEQTRPIAMTRTAIAAAQHHLRSAAPAAPAAEPVGWQYRWLDPEEGPSLWVFCDAAAAETYRRSRRYEVREVSAPGSAPAAESPVPVPLTDGQLREIAESEASVNRICLFREDAGRYEVTHVFRCIARAIERAHGIGSKP